MLKEWLDSEFGWMEESVQGVSLWELTHEQREKLIDNLEKMLAEIYRPLIVNQNECRIEAVERLSQFRFCPINGQAVSIR